MVLATGKALDAGPLTGCDSTLSRLNLALLELRQLKVLTEAMCRYFERNMSNPDTKVPCTAIRLMQNLQNDMDCLTDSYEFLKNQLYLSRRTVSRALVMTGKI